MGKPRGNGNNVKRGRSSDFGSGSATFDNPLDGEQEKEEEKDNFHATSTPSPSGEILSVKTFDDEDRPATPVSRGRRPSITMESFESDAVSASNAAAAFEVRQPPPPTSPRVTATSPQLCTTPRSAAVVSTSSASPSPSSRG